VQEEGAGNEAGGGARAVLICPAPPVERRGTQPAPGQFLCLSLKVPLIPFQRGKEMQMCGGMFSCVCANASIVRQDPASPKVQCLLRHCLSATLLLCPSHIFCFMHYPSTVCSELPPGHYQSQASTSAKWEHTHMHTLLSSLPLQRLCVPVFSQENRIV